MTSAPAMLQRYSLNWRYTFRPLISIGKVWKLLLMFAISIANSRKFTKLLAWQTAAIGVRSIRGQAIWRYAFDESQASNSSFTWAAYDGGFAAARRHNLSVLLDLFPMPPRRFANASAPALPRADAMLWLTAFAEAVFVEITYGCPFHSLKQMDIPVGGHVDLAPGSLQFQSETVAESGVTGSEAIWAAELAGCIGRQ
jgi:hypothetical protein